MTAQTTPSSFSTAIATIDAALPALGSPKMQAAVLRSLAIAVAGTDAQRDALIALLDESLNEKTAPAPAPERKRHPQPADFDERPLIGHVAGEPLYGQVAWDTVSGKASRYGATIHLCGLNIYVRPHDLDDELSPGDYLSFDTEELAGCGDVLLRDWGKMRELATMPGDPVAQAMELTRRWCNAGAEAEQRRAA